MSEDRLEDSLRDLLRELEPSPEPPREAMWQAIQARRAAARTAPGRATWLDLFRPRPWLVWAPAMAAVLALGIALGRWTDATVPAEPGPAVSVEEPARGATTDVYTLAALRHLGSAESLLVGFHEDARAGRTEDVARWAGELLTDTRLLADSPAGDDPEIARLLSDLELVLAQIAVLRADPRLDDVLLIEDGIDQNDVLLRLRAATGNGIAAGL